MNITAALAALRIVHARLVAPYAPKPHPPSLETPITAATLAAFEKIAGPLLQERVERVIAKLLT